MENGSDVERTIRRAIGDDPGAIAWVATHANTTVEPTVIAMAALLDRDPERIAKALAVATTSRDRQLIAIVGAHLRGDHQLVDALARDHLADHPDSFMVAWIASDSAGRARGTDQP
jgi:prolyl-tRNA editing enzyme YbaK/EbsC (Cys-tRNA(Pro) deacylase)